MFQENTSQKNTSQEKPLNPTEQAKETDSQNMETNLPKGVKKPISTNM